MKVNVWAGVAGLCAVFAAGAATAYLWTARAPASTTSQSAAADREGAVATRGGAETPRDVITIAAELMERAHIAIAAAGTSSAAAGLRVPGTVQPNAYRRVTVTPLVGGRITRVAVELGQRVAAGALLVEAYSPEVAEARARYLAASADMEAGEAKLRRTERLAALGSASGQELDEVRAEHVRHETDTREAAARLRLFGLDPARLAHADPLADAAASVIRVTAPQAGVVIERPATPGMTVEPSTPLVTIADLSPVWVIADVYERDIARVAAGAPATITSEAYPGVPVEGRVTYLSPDVRPETRTTQVRVEAPNPDGRLRFGMFVTVVIGGAAAAAVVTVPKTAVQTIGPDAVVFVPDGAAGNTFRERRVTLGETLGDQVAVVSGLAAGERVVTQGSFALRAEAERLGILPAQPQQSLTVEITAKGFEPNVLEVKAGIPVRMTFIRRTDATCATDLSIPDHGIKRDLPLNTPVTVEFTPLRTVVLQCGMGMLSGTLMVR